MNFIIYDERGIAIHGLNLDVNSWREGYNYFIEFTKTKDYKSTTDFDIDNFQYWLMVNKNVWSVEFSVNNRLTLKVNRNEVD